MGNSESKSEVRNPLPTLALPIIALLYLAFTEDSVVPFPPRRETHADHPQNQQPSPAVRYASPAARRAAVEEEIDEIKRETFSPSPRRRILEKRRAAAADAAAAASAVAVTLSDVVEDVPHPSAACSPPNARLLGSSRPHLVGDSSPLSSLARSRSRAAKQLPPMQPADLQGDAARPWSQYLMATPEDEEALLHGQQHMSPLVASGGSTPAANKAPAAADGAVEAGADSLNATHASLSDTVASLERTRTLNRHSSLRNFAAQHLMAAEQPQQQQQQPLLRTQSASPATNKSMSPEASPPRSPLSASRNNANVRNPLPLPPIHNVDDDDDDDHGDDGEDDGGGHAKNKQDDDDDEEDMLERTATAVAEMEREITFRNTAEAYGRQHAAGMAVLAAEYARTMEQLQSRHELGLRAAVKASADRTTTLLNEAAGDEKRARTALESEQLGAIGKLRREFEAGLVVVTGKR